MESTQEREERLPEAVLEYVKCALQGSTQSTEDQIDAAHFEKAANLRSITWNQWQFHIWKRENKVRETNRMTTSKLIQILKIFAKKQNSNCGLLKEIWREATYYEKHRDVRTEDAVMRLVSFKSMQRDTDNLVRAANEAESMLQDGGRDSHSIKELITQKSKLWKQLLEWDSSKEEKAWYAFQKLKQEADEIITGSEAFISQLRTRASLGREPGDKRVVHVSKLRTRGELQELECAMKSSFGDCIAMFPPQKTYPNPDYCFCRFISEKHAETAIKAGWIRAGSKRYRIKTNFRSTYKDRTHQYNSQKRSA
ncbi:hypothetical protein CRE_23579 [Caenorhabditis remanei]|uniref:Uncharacterized protein n=1 Tax=Caenorhabditis remanei TaxID=31234 RepID=E3MVW6_CAERE|nr:hypothetical protein CRE_23579 [Caenorhabditis remanei]